MPSVFIRLWSLAVAPALLVAATALAQPNTVSGFAGTSRLTSPDNFDVPALGIAIDRDLTSWLAVSADVVVARRAQTDQFGLIAGLDDWYSRFQTSGSLSVISYPVRFRALGARHRSGVFAGPVLRYKNERFHYAGFVGTVPFDSPEFVFDSIREMNERWRAMGPDYEVIQFEHPGGGDERPPGALPEWYEPGLVNALILNNQEWDVGLAGGLAYEAALGRTVVGLRTQARRYRDQGSVTGSHTFDFSARVGYRF